MVPGMKTGSAESEGVDGCKVADVLMEGYWDNVENSFSWQVSRLSFVSVTAKKNT